MEKIQRDVTHNHRLVPGPELEEKALVLKQLGETLTELKGEPALAKVTPRASLPCSPAVCQLLGAPPQPAYSSCPLSSFPRPAE